MPGVPGKRFIKFIQHDVISYFVAPLIAALLRERWSNIRRFILSTQWVEQGMYKYFVIQSALVSNRYLEAIYTHYLVVMKEGT
jgi:hypothetical protein